MHMECTRMLCIAAGCIPGKHSTGGEGAVHQAIQVRDTLTTYSMLARKAACCQLLASHCLLRASTKSALRLWCLAASFASRSELEGVSKKRKIYTRTSFWQRSAAQPGLRVEELEHESGGKTCRTAPWQALDMATPCSGARQGQQREASHAHEVHKPAMHCHRLHPRQALVVRVMCTRQSRCASLSPHIAC